MLLYNDLLLLGLGLCSMEMRKLLSAASKYLEMAVTVN
jgi:hypothetical protein